MFTVLKLRGGHPIAFVKLIKETHGSDVRWKVNYFTNVPHCIKQKLRAKGFILAFPVLGSLIIYNFKH